MIMITIEIPEVLLQELKEYYSAKFCHIWRKSHAIGSSFNEDVYVDAIKLTAGEIGLTVKHCYVEESAFLFKNESGIEIHFNPNEYPKGVNHDDYGPYWPDQRNRCLN